LEYRVKLRDSTPKRGKKTDERKTAPGWFRIAEGAVRKKLIFRENGFHRRETLMGSSSSMCRRLWEIGSVRKRGEGEKKRRGAN